MNPEALYLIALKSIPYIGDIIARRLINVVGSAKDIFELKDNDLKKLDVVPNRVVKQIVENRHLALEKAEKEIEFINKHNIQFISIFDDNYPYRLSHCIDAPLFFFYKGSVDVESKYMVSVVGTRKSTVYGRKMTEQLVQGLNMSGVTIVSGLAHGIDTVAHQTAVSCSIPTIAVLGHGFKQLYPEENRKLAKDILKNGGLLTEFLSDELPEKQNFPIRNRIIAGMSDAVVVVEAQSRGGALITAEIAHSYSRDIFTFPGRADDQKSRGCNWLLRTQRAALIESAEHLKYFMNWISEEGDKPQQTSINMLLDENSQKIFDYLSEFGERNIDQICNDLDFSINKAAMVLLDLEFQGVLAALPGKRYKLKYF